MRKINGRVGLCIGLLSLTTLSACVQTRESMHRPTLGNTKRSCNRHQKKWIGGALATLLATGGIAGGILYANSESSSTIPKENGTNVTSRPPYIPPATSFPVVSNATGSSSTNYRTNTTTPYLPSTTEKNNIKECDASVINIPYCECLIHNGKDLNLKDIQGKTLLMRTIESNNIDVANFLINSNKTDLNIKNVGGATAFISAADYGRKDTTELLINKGVNINQSNNNGETALILSTKRNRIDVAKLLIENKVNLDIKDNYGETALRASVGYANSIDIAELLVKNKANLDIKDNNGETALRASVGYNSIDIAKLLVENNANLDIKDNSGETALRASVGYNSIDIAKLLVENNANLDIKDNSGETALIASVGYNSIDIAKLLVEKKQILI